MKKIILTGATGFIGSHFAEHLTSKGIEVLALGRKSFSEISDLRKKRLSLPATFFVNFGKKFFKKIFTKIDKKLQEKKISTWEKNCVSFP